jgi:PAS domain S-box-containing protein
LSRRAVELTFVTAVLAAEVVGAILLIHASDHEPHKVLAASLAITAGVSFVFAGMIALNLRPENPTGLYLALVGFLWFFGALPEANNNVVYTIGAALSNLCFIPFAALMLSFPTGRLDRTGKRIVEATAWFVVLGPPIVFLVSKTPKWGCSGDCPESAIVVRDAPTLARIVELTATAVTAAIIVSLVVVLALRWRAATAPARRVLLPVYAAGTATLLALLLGNVLDAFSTALDEVIGALFLALFLLVPWAFLFGILRSRFARGSVAGMMVGLEHGQPLRPAIAEALGDPSLGLAFWLEDEQRWVDSEGRTLDLENVPSAAITLVEREGRRVGALLHDESLAAEPELVESVTAAAAFAFDNERLQAELRHQNALLATIVDTAPSLLLTVDTEARIRTLNPATLDASGRAEESDVLGQYFWDIFIDPSEREAMRARFFAGAPDHPPAEYENTFSNARGERMSIIWRGAPVKGDAGEVEGIVAAGLDVTDHRRAEEEIRASRGRIVAAGDEERRRLERNLHDGAQQRLVSLSLALRLAQSRLESDPAGASEILTGASEELAAALEELRELARGIHPAVLTDRGLDAALEGLAARTPVPVELDRVGRRLPAPIEAAAYYVVSEAVANVVKHGHASSIRVDLEAENGTFRVQVSDDGVGGADAAAGSGLRGLADRVSALDGRLELESPPGAGTRVTAELPLPPVVAAE